mmetsp:Transcript_96509/g.185342  ORF Transcript_96509/g.185342 Transcript_96509/m.185342 type:complete len:80 (+) Transcript_96509:266-505(+)
MMRRRKSTSTVSAKALVCLIILLLPRSAQKFFQVMPSPIGTQDTSDGLFDRLRLTAWVWEANWISLQQFPGNGNLLSIS